MDKEATEKSTLRNKSIGTKVSEDEYAALEKLAEARGLTLGEWLRELVLAELIAHPADWTADSSWAQGEIRQLLRSEGVKWSVKHVSNDAALLGKVAGAFGKVLATKSAYDRYQKCRGH